MDLTSIERARVLREQAMALLNDSMALLAYRQQLCEARRHLIATAKQARQPPQAEPGRTNVSPSH